MNARELLIETFIHIPPANLLEKFTPEQAGQRPPGAPHSIAETVAHMAFWQSWLCDRCDGIARPIVTSAADGWPEPGRWSDLQAGFTAGLERAAALGARADEPVAPAIEFPPLAHYTVRDAIVHMAQHNSHHLGQVILMRQMMGLWPPPAGSFTW